MNKLDHIAIIMDGNRRWGKENNKSVKDAYIKGIKTTKEIIEHSAKIKLPYLTLFAFSYENWQRPKNEVKELMTMFEYYLKEELPNFHENNIKLKFIGELEKLSSSLQKAIIDAHNLTKDNNLMQLNIAVSYSAKKELVNAVNDAISSNKGGLITEQDIEDSLYTSGIPDPDILIRTGGERRISNFLLWQLSYTEIFFETENWPDFGVKKFDKIIEKYHQIERKFGVK